MSPENYDRTATVERRRRLSPRHLHRLICGSRGRRARTRQVCDSPARREFSSPGCCGAGGARYSRGSGWSAGEAGPAGCGSQARSWGGVGWGAGGAGTRALLCALAGPGSWFGHSVTTPHGAAAPAGRWRGHQGDTHSLLALPAGFNSGVVFSVRPFGWPPSKTAATPFR